MNNFWKVFYIIKGRVKVTVHKSSAILHTGSTFFVPQGKYFFHFFYKIPVRRNLFKILLTEYMHFTVVAAVVISL